MKVTANIFWIIGAFFILMGTIYGVWVKWTEWAGIPAIYALGAMSFMIALYFNLVGKSFGEGPADDEDGEIVAYQGEYGNFSPWSWWPLGISSGCAIVVIGLATGQWWVFIGGALASVYFLVGWVYEHSRGKYAH